MRSDLLLVGGAVALALAVASCGDEDPGAAGTADDPRTIEVTALDPFMYEPTSVYVEAGETVRFVVTNDGETDHEFVVGDMEMQEMAEEQMSEGMGDHGQAMASLELEPG